MSAISIIVAVAVLKLLLSLLAARGSRATAPADANAQQDEEDEWGTVFRPPDPFDDDETGKTGNLPSEEYGCYAGSKSFFEDE